MRGTMYFCEEGALISIWDLLWTPNFMGVVDTKHMLDDPPKNINKVKAYHDLCAHGKSIM